ncbi:MAG: hypothetical protein ACYC25_17280 [Paludibacter sp.]
MNNNTMQTELVMTSTIPPVNRRRIKDLRIDELDRPRPLRTEWTNRSREYPRTFRRVLLP